MSLNIEWFAASNDRNKERDSNGVSIEEAESDLAFSHSSVSPIAIETARWLYKNWTIEKFFQLSSYSRLDLLRIIECEIIDTTSKENMHWYKAIEIQLLLEHEKSKTFGSKFS